jgi:hypothetical protein
MNRGVLHFAEKFQDEVKRNTESPVIPTDWKERFLAKIETWETEAVADRQRQIDRLTAELGSLKLRLDRLNAAFVDASLELAECRELKNPLIGQEADL